FYKLVAGMSVGALAAMAHAQTNAEPTSAAPAFVAGQPMLSQVVERAITTHPEIQARYHDFVSNLEEQNVARAGWRPQITAAGWTGKEWRGNVEAAPSSNWNRTGWSLELRQLLFDGGATSNRIRQFGFEKLAYYD